MHGSAGHWRLKPRGDGTSTAWIPITRRPFWKALPSSIRVSSFHEPSPPHWRQTDSSFLMCWNMLKMTWTF